jgi:hypothetical protein
MMNSLLGRLSDRYALRRVRSAARGGRRPSVESLEDRLVPSTLSSIVSNFNGTSLAPGSSVWFSSVAKVQGLGGSPVTIHVTQQEVTFSVGGSPVTVAMPDADVTLSPAATTATTTFDVGSNKWLTTVPANLGGNVFVAGVIYPVPSGLPGGINPVTWQAQFSTDTAGVSLQWQWAAAAYKSFGTDYNAVGVKPVDSNTASRYQNSDHAGTPENFRQLVTGGARGGGGSNFTGSYSATKAVTPPVDNPPVPPPPPPLASLSGTIFQDDNGNGVRDAGEVPVGGVWVTLTGTDALGNAVSLSVQTDNNGFYVFAGLQAGTYTISHALIGYDGEIAKVGTVNGSTDGTVTANGALGQIQLAAGDNGINYNFAELVAGS